MPRLADRKKLPPGGLRFYQPETNWFPTPHASFDETVAQIMEHRQRNRHLAERYSWPLDQANVALELDSFNTKVCVEMGWKDWITSGNPPELPKEIHPGVFSAGEVAGYLSPVKKLAAGAALLMDWEESGQPPVSAQLSEARAATCVLRPNGQPCPKNSSESVSAWFTVPVANAIKSRMQRLHELKLTTPYDEKLNVCAACLCPLKLKVHTPLDLIRKRLKPEVLAELDSECWILKELKASAGVV